MSARDNILKRLNQTPIIASSTPFEDRSVLRGFWQYDKRGRIDRLQMLLEAVKTEVHRVTPDSWMPVLWQLLNQKRVRTLGTGSGIPETDAIKKHAPETFEIKPRNCATLNKTELFHEMDAAFTTSRCAIASTGTIVVWPTEQEPRQLSLVPPIHIVLVDGSKVANNFDELMEAEQWQSGMPANSVLISGPSKTADIQQTLAYGAHGPKELVVLLLDPFAEDAQV